jgi:hypothetical protein
MASKVLLGRGAPSHGERIASIPSLPAGLHVCLDCSYSEYSIVSLSGNKTGIRTEISSFHYRPDVQVIGVPFSAWPKIFSSVVSIPALGPTQPSVHLVSGALSPRLKRPMRGAMPDFRCLHDMLRN